MISTNSSSFDHVTLEAPGFSLPRIHKRLVLVSVLVLVGTNTVEGPLRLLLVRFHAESLLYLRDALALLAISTYFFASRSFSRLKLGLTAFFFALLASAFYARTINTQSAAIAMGLKVFLPVFIGAIYTQRLHEEPDVWPAWPAILGLFLTVVGLQWSAVSPTPWAGIDYTAAGLNIEGTRAWTIDGIDRVAGFTRSSGDAANLILLFYVFVIMARRSWFNWILLTAVSAYGLHLTTMRSSFLGLLMVASVSLLLRAPKTGGLIKASILLAMFVAIGAPWLGKLLVHGDAAARGEGLTSSGSMVMRVNEVWPDMLARFHGVADYVLGLGMGNVGVPQKLFRPTYYNPADNLALYALAVFGAGSIVFHLLFARRVLRSAPSARMGAEALFLGLTGMVYAVGLAMNGFESIPLGVAIGLMLGLALRSQANDWEQDHG
jgi:hypothetical protein